jgi:nucleoside-diphosphate-sugar epimerase
MSSKPVAVVLGIDEFIGTHITQKFLMNGYQVRGTSLEGPLKLEYTHSLKDFFKPFVDSGDLHLHSLQEVGNGDKDTASGWKEMFRGQRSADLLVPTVLTPTQE